MIELLGIANYDYFSYKDFGIPTSKSAMRKCLAALRKYKPDVVFSHYPLDYIDHKNAAAIVESAYIHSGKICVLDLGEPRSPRTLYHFEVLQLPPKVSDVVDITATFEYKLQAMKAYASQHPLLSGIFNYLKGVAKARGNLIGVKYGEALSRTTAIPKAITKIEDF